MTDVEHVEQVLGEPALRPAPTRATTIAEVRAIAGQEALDGVRGRRQLVVRAVTPVVLFVCVLGVTLLLRGSDTRTHPNAYRVAVEGDYAGARETLAHLTTDRLEFFPATDARRATIEGADTGIRVPDGLDDLLRANRAGNSTVEIYQMTINPPSRAAAALIQSGFVDLHAQAVQTRLSAAGAAQQTMGKFAPVGVDVQVTAQGTQNLTAQVIPGLICLQAALLVTGTANRLVSRRNRGLVTAQLLLPVSRRALALAKGLGELVIGIVASAPVLLAVLLFAAVVAFREGSASSLVAHVGATIIGALSLFLAMTAVGLYIGTAARTQEQVSLATGGAVIVAALVAAFVALGDTIPPDWIALIPFAGSVGELRAVLAGSGSVVAFAVATLTTLGAAFLIAAMAGRSLDAERMVLRSA